MKKIRKILAHSNNFIVTAVLTLFIMHFLSVHGVANALTVCFEGDGNVNIESVVGEIITIPSERALHDQAPKNAANTSFNTVKTGHSDIAFSDYCSKEQRTTRFSQQRMLNVMSNIVNLKIVDLPRSLVFTIVSYIPPTIEDPIKTSLSSVVRILYN